MSILGPGNIGALNLAGSIAGTQRNGAAADREKEVAADRNNQINQQAQAAHNHEDIAETDLNADRDADGRLLYAEAPGSGEAGETSEDAPKDPLRPTDAFGERGNTLDLEA